MTEKKTTIVTEDSWGSLKSFTDARINLGRCGSSLPLREVLGFKLAHAQARDAVLQPFQIDELKARLEAAGHECLKFSGDVESRSEYLTRPDKGRRLNAASVNELEGAKKGYDLCLVVSDGLSSRAIHENGFDFLEMFLPLAQRAGIKVAPVCLVENGRVAIADEIGERLNARLSVILIGERPGLSSPNSLGIYMTYGPKVGNTDEARNCISNVREGGMSIEDGVRKLAYLSEMAFVGQLSGSTSRTRCRRITCRSAASSHNWKSSIDGQPAVTGYLSGCQRNAVAFLSKIVSS